MASFVSLAAIAGLTHRLRAFGVDLDYTQFGDSPQTRRVRGIINGEQERRNMESGGFDADVSATLRLPRTIGFTPAINDTVTVSAGISYRISSVGNVPHSPEWRLGLEQLAN
jgi:hypothetical protein